MNEKQAYTAIKEELEKHDVDVESNEALDVIYDALAELATLKQRLKRKCEDEARAVKCICDVETYLDLGSVRYALGVIGKWRTPEESEAALKEAQK